MLQDYRFGVEVVTKVVSPCSAKEKSKKVLVQRAGETLVVTSELPLLNGRICSLVERLSIENDFMRQVCEMEVEVLLLRSTS